MEVDDSSDCTISSSLSLNYDSPDFDSRLIGSIAAVSDNTRFRQQRRPIKINTTTSPIKQRTQPFDEPFPSISSNTNNNNISSLPHHNNNTHLSHIEEDNGSLSTPASTQNSIFESTIQELGLTLSDFNSSSLSPKQIAEITNAIISHLQKHGRITTELLHFIRDKNYSSKNATSSTPDDRPTLLSSDKPSNTFPSHIRLTIPQLLVILDSVL